MAQKIQIIAVAGAGTMGLGIAQVCAVAGYKTLLFDINPDMLSKAKSAITKSLQSQVDKGKMLAENKDLALSKITFTTELNDLVADLVIEAIVERLEVKHQFFQNVAQINNPETILASNTSSIPITQ
ncbi:MAG: 3-hydroxyacyl-CoA dehydrogenase family protein, partial [Bacteroidia bacterium]